MSRHSTLFISRWQTTAAIFFSGMLALSLAPLFSEPTHPAWWNDRNVKSGNPAQNKGVANIGQLKHIATKAHAELEYVIPDGANFNLPFDEPPPSPSPEWYQNQKKALNLGQLKAVAKPFYDRLNAISPAWVKQQLVTNGLTNLGVNYFQATNGYYYPWNPATPVSENYKVATVGQLKLVFALRLREDSDTDNIPDLYEFQIINASSVDQISDLSHVTAVGDYDGDGVSNFTEWVDKTSPVDAGDYLDVVVDQDTDNDDLPDSWEIAMANLDPTDSYTSIASFNRNDDLDGDGLSNYEEYNLGLVPINIDTDGDGYSDRISHGLLGYWKLDSILDSVIEDVLGEMHGIASTNLILIPDDGVFANSNSLGFSQVGDHIFLPEGVLNTQADLTFSIWFKTSQATGIQTIASGADSTNANEFVITLVNGSSLEFHTGESSVSKVSWNVGSSLADGNWHHLALVRNQSQQTVSVYVDSQQIGTSLSTLLTNLSVGANGFVLGQSQISLGGGFDVSQKFIGELGEMRLYGWALDATSVVELHVLADSDLDGMPDHWERTYFGSVSRIGDGAGDEDNDGITNAQEYTQGTSPVDYYNGVLPVISVISGDMQEVALGQETPLPIRFRVTDSNGVPLVGAPVDFSALGLSGGTLRQGSSSVSSELFYNLRTGAQGEVDIYYTAP